MGRNRYLITETDRPHFLTCTVVQWLPVFTRPETVEILLDCWQYQRENQGLKLYGYVILENHCHFISQAENLSKCVSSFKSYTARRIIDLLKQRKEEILLKHLRFAKLAHKQDRDYQFWQEGVHAELIFSEEMMWKKAGLCSRQPG